jgi:hypothetical protein
VAASLICSFVVNPEVSKAMKPTLDGFRTLWFALAFTCIGLETRFVELFQLDGGRPAAAFVLAQAFNVVWTLILAFVLFGLLVLP